MEKMKDEKPKGIGTIHGIYGPPIRVHDPAEYETLVPSESEVVIRDDSPPGTVEIKFQPKGAALFKPDN
jgi:hypothetical protein